MIVASLPRLAGGDAPPPEKTPAPQRRDCFLGVGPDAFQRISGKARVLPDLTFRQEIRITDGPHYFVDIGHVAVSSGGMLFTNGLWPCVAVAVRNKETRRALLLHASSADQADLLKRALPDLGKGPLEAYIAGGDESSGSKATMEAIARVLEERKIPLAGYRPNHGIDGLAIDPITGAVY